MTETLKPQNGDQVLEALQWAVSSETPVALTAGGTKQALGRPSHADALLDLSQLRGVTLFEPDELVLSAGPATPMAEIEALLREHQQALAFEPPDWGPLFGHTAGGQTLGGVLACNLAGPRRIKAGAARDHFLGLRGVTGRGEAVKSGGRVVKNVTGYDLCKLVAGSYGTLLALTAVTVKVLPAPEKVRTVLVFGLSDEDAVRALSAAACSPHEVSGLAHLPAAAAARSGVGYVNGAGCAVTAVRIEGPAPSVTHRTQALRQQFTADGETEELHFKNSRQLWGEIANVVTLLPTSAPVVWKLSVTPSQAPGIVAALRDALALEVYYDWAGGLVWLALPEATEGMDQTIRGAIADQGHATLIRAGEEIRQKLPVFHPQPAALRALSQRVKESFDPLHLLNRGRLYAEAG